MKRLVNWATALLFLALVAWGVYWLDSAGDRYQCAGGLTPVRIPHSAVVCLILAEPKP